MGYIEFLSKPSEKTARRFLISCVITNISLMAAIEKCLRLEMSSLYGEAFCFHPLWISMELARVPNKYLTESWEINPLRAA